MKPAAYRLTIFAVGCASTAYAATGNAGEETGLLFWLFCAFGALILVFQLVPGLFMFFSMMKGLFAVAGKEGTPATASDQKRS